LDSLITATSKQPSEGIDTPWQRFLKQLSEPETALMTQLAAAGSLSEVQIDDFARAHALMGNVLIDSINRKSH